MNSILYNYFIPRGIFLLIFFIIGYYILKKEIPKWSLILFIPFSLLFGYAAFSGPNIIWNVIILKKLENLKAENVREINIFEKSFTESDEHQPIPNSLYRIKNKKEISSILNILKRNEFYNYNFGAIEKFYGLTITLKDKSEIYFTIIKSKDNIYPKLLNEQNGKYYTIGTYKNNALSKILLE